MNILKLFEVLSLFCCLAYARPTIEGTESVSYPTAVVDGSTGQGGEVVKIEGDANPDKAQELLDGITTSELETEQTTNATSISSGEKREDSISEAPVSEEQNRVETPNSLELGEPTNPEVRMGTSPGELIRVPVPTSSEDPSSDVITNLIDIVVKPARAFNGSGATADAEVYGSTETSPTNSNSESTTPHYVTAPEDDGYIEKWGLDEGEVKEKIEEAYVTVSGPDAEANTVPSDQALAESVANLPVEENASAAVEDAPTISEESATSVETNTEITAAQDIGAAPASIAANLDSSGYDSTPSLVEGSSEAEDDVPQQISELTTGYSEVSEVPSLDTSADVEVSSGEEPAESVGEQAVTVTTHISTTTEEAKAGELVSEQVDAVEEKSQVPNDQPNKETQNDSVEEGSGQQTQSENIELPEPTSSGEIPSLDDNSINTPPYPEFVTTAAAEIVSSDAEIQKDSNDSNAEVTSSYSDSTTSLYSGESLSDNTESDTIEERESSGVLPSDVVDTRVASPSEQVHEVQTTEGSVNESTESHKKELAEVEVNAATVPTETSTQTSTISAANDKPENIEVLLTTTTASRSPWKRYEFDCDTEVDDKGVLCKDWALGGLCEVHPPTRFLFCRKTCLCTGPQ